MSGKRVAKNAKKKLNIKTKVLIIVLVILLVVATGLVVWKFFIHKQEEESEKVISLGTDRRDKR